MQVEAASLAIQDEPSRPIAGGVVAAGVVGPLGIRRPVVRTLKLLTDGQPAAGYYYFSRDNKQHGPTTREELARLYANGDVHARTYVWCFGQHGWQELVKVCPNLLRSSVVSEQV